MRIPSGKTDQTIYFVAVDPLTQAEKTGLSSFTVYRSRNGGAATAFTSPTITELSAANMPGVYGLLVNQDTTIASGSDSEEYCLFITQASMASVTRTIELYRRDTTSGATSTAQTGDSYARLGAPAGASQAADIAAIKAVLPTALVGGRIDASVGAVASGVIAAASFAANALDAVWSTTTRLLSAGTNIVLAKGTGITGFNDLDASGIRAAAGLASANLDTQLSAINTKTTNLPAAPADESLIIAATSALAASIAALPTANSNADALLDRANGIETGWTLRQVLRISFSVLAGRGYGLAGTAARFRDAADTKNRVSAVINSSGDRTVTLDAS